MNIVWNYKNFDELNTRELYAILQLRNQVFIVEQNCPYLDLDEKDFKSFHLMGLIDGQLAAYCRILPPSISFDEASIGRVISSGDFRGMGIGKELLKCSIEKVYSSFGKQPIKIGAQHYLKEFYESFGFQSCSDIYLEDGIPHLEMILQ